MVALFCMSGELWFYHLEQSGLDEVLPGLLEKSLQRGWRVLVRSPDEERLQQLDQTLWTWRDDSFLPHGLETGADPGKQPILLSGSETGPNDPQVLILLDGAEPEALTRFERCIMLFDGHDESAVVAARRLWKQASGDGVDVSYWRQGENGGWQKKA